MKLLQLEIGIWNGALEVLKGPEPSNTRLFSVPVHPQPDGQIDHVVALDAEHVLEIRLSGRRPEIMVTVRRGPDALFSTRTCNQSVTVDVALPNPDPHAPMFKNAQYHGYPVRTSAWRDGPVTVRMSGARDIHDRPGATCLTPDVPTVRDRVYERSFDPALKRVFLAHELDQAVAHAFPVENRFVIGLNGFTALDAETARLWGVDPQTYLLACGSVLRYVVTRLRARFEGMNLCMVHGTTHMGIDAVQIDVAKELNVPQLGCSCEEYAFYIPCDDGVPTHLAETVNDYSQTFASVADVMITMHGRVQTMQMDLFHMLHQRGHVVLFDLLRFHSDNGGPAVCVDDAINDASGLLQSRLHVVGTQRVRTEVWRDGTDRWQAAANELVNVLSNIVRAKLGPALSVRL